MFFGLRAPFEERNRYSLAREKRIFCSARLWLRQYLPDNDSALRTLDAPHHRKNEDGGRSGIVEKCRGIAE
jgi:hypothetical protein